MFFKKNKPDPLQEATLHNAPPQDASPQSSAPGGQSIFAPKLNVAPAQVDFGFNHFQPEDYSQPRTPAPPAPPAWEPEAWKTPAPEAESTTLPGPTAQIAADSPSLESTLPPWETLEPLPEMASFSDPVVEASPAGLPPSTFDLSPEQAWAMMETSSGTAPLEPDFSLNEAIPPFEAFGSALIESPELIAPTLSEKLELPAEASGGFSSPAVGPESLQADWASEFDAPSAERSISSLEEPWVAHAVDPVSESAAPPLDFSLDWRVPDASPIDWGTDTAAFVVPHHADAADSPEPVSASDAALAFDPAFEPQLLALESSSSGVGSPGLTGEPELPAFGGVERLEPVADFSIPALESATLEEPLPFAVQFPDMEITGSATSFGESDSEWPALSEWADVSAFSSEPIEAQQPQMELFSSEAAPVAPGASIPKSINTESPSFSSLEESSWDAPFGDLTYVDPTAPLGGEFSPSPGLGQASETAVNPPFDPGMASQALAEGWAALEHRPDANATGFGLAEELRDQPVRPRWEDENLPSGGMSQQALATEWGQPSFDSTEPVYLHEVSTSPQAEAVLWQNLNAPETARPGEQVPLASGAYMDAINQQLYPADPFATLNDEFSAGEQAFAEAAQYLFPETMSASLEWSEEAYGDDLETTASIEPLGLDDDVPVMDLGPSYLPQAQGFSQMSPASAAQWPTQADAAFYADPAPPIPEAFVGTPQPYPSYPEAAPEVIAPPAVAPSHEARQPSSADLAAWFAADAPLSPETSVSGSLHAPIYEPEPLLPDSDDPWMSAGALLPPQAYDPSLVEDGHLDPMAGAPAAPISPSLGEEQDFYATAYTLNEVGELVPLHEEDLFIELPPLPQPKVASEIVADEEVVLSSDEAALWGQDLTQAFSLMAEPQWTETPTHATDAIQSFARESFAPVEDHGTLFQPGVQPADEPVTTYTPSTAWQDLIAPYVAAPTETPRSAVSSSDQLGAPAGRQPVASVQALSAEPETPALPQQAEAELPPEKQIIYPKPLNRKMPTFLSPTSQPALESPKVLPQPALNPGNNTLPGLPPVVSAAPPVLGHSDALPSSDISTASDSLMASDRSAPDELLTTADAVGPPPEGEAGSEREVAAFTVMETGLKTSLEAGPEPAPEALQEAWYSPPTPPPVEAAELTSMEATPAEVSPEGMSQKLSGGNLEVMGLCQLSPDKRLMVVQSDGVYALMAQSGPGQADVNVLKVFEHNPLAYQHTFTAVAEGQASGQGMFVTQVGTWHAIISTFQDKITLHTELG